MPEPLRVNPTDLFLSANHLEAHHGDHTQVHEAANTAIESSSAGWVGTSAAALQAKMADLQAITSHISGELAHHRDAFHQIGHGYENMDEDGAIDILRARDSL